MDPSFRKQPAWIVVLLVLLGWQAWLTLHLFGPDQPLRRLTDESPIISGRHPLHLYHGFLGAASLIQRGTLACFDPAFQAGYPKTPIFDGGSRPAEVFLALAGGSYRPAAYKLGLALCCCLVPLLLAAAARGAGLGPAWACLVAAIGMLVWWGKSCRTLLEAGDLDLLLAILATLVHVGLLLQFHRRAGLLGWLGLLASACLGWFAQPLLFTILMVPLLLVYFHSVGTRHCVSWHLALLAGLAGGVVLNFFWLVDWLAYWWLRVPLPSGQPLLAQVSWRAFWCSSVWGSPADRVLAILLLGSGAGGLGLLAWRRERAAARLLGLSTAGLLLLSLAGMAWEPLGRQGAPRLLAPALWFASLPAVHAWSWIARELSRRAGPVRAAVLATAVLLPAGWLVRADLADLAGRASQAEPLTIGFHEDQLSAFAMLRAHTTSDARILWEDCQKPATAPRWTALLAVAVGRSFLGGLDPEPNMEHAFASLVDETLAGRPLAEWNDAELAAFGQRYNIGWVVARSEPMKGRLASWCGAGQASRTAIMKLDGAEAWLFTLARPRSYVLKGQARWLSADSGHIVLGDVVPEDGLVVLSLHYQAGMQVQPSQVRLERDPDPLDPIPFLRLRMPGPVSRITLTWENP